MADRNFYSVKTALRVGIVQMLNGLISIGIGAYNTRKEDHNAFLKFKPEGLPVWSGILVRMIVITSVINVCLKSYYTCMKRSLLKRNSHV